jgi:UDP-3-O-[3-hydroxymyristoyl] glucosamine N-acyltransferase
MDSLQAAGWMLPPVVHPRAVIAPDARLGEGVFVAAGAVVESACDIGRGAIIDIGTLIDHECRIGAFAHLRAPGAIGPRAVWPAA